MGAQAYEGGLVFEVAVLPTALPLVPILTNCCSFQILTQLQSVLAGAGLMCCV